MSQGVVLGIGNTLNRLYFVARGIERAATMGCVGTLISVIAMYATQALDYSHPIALALPCMLYGLSNGIVVANTTIGAISASGRHAGTGTGLAGAMQMAAGGIFGSLIIALGGAEDFLLASTVLGAMAATAVVSMIYVYRRRAEIA